MSTIQRYRTAFLGIAAVLAVALVAPVAAQTEDQPIAAAHAAPSWDETSGYGAVEANRAVIGHDDVVSGYAATGHEASAALGLSWDETSGYGSVEASRAAGCDVTLSDLGAALAAGTRAESAHLATIPLPGECD